jgi:hydrogenase nickel incorporation protein HypA/HybF
MHEMSLCESLLQIIERQAASHAFTRVRAVRVEIGALACVEPEALRFCFDAAARGTLAEGAVLEIVTRPGEAWCWDCQAVVPLPDLTAPCPQCNGYRREARTGDDLRLKELEVE